MDHVYRVEIGEGLNEATDNISKTVKNVSLVRMSKEDFTDSYNLGSQQFIKRIAP